MRSQALLAQKPKRVGRLANVGAKVRNINETVKLFGNFLLFNNFFTWFEGCLSTVHLIKWEVSHGTISPAKAAYLRESSGTGSLQYIGSLFRVDEPVPDDSSNQASLLLCSRPVAL